LILRLCFSRPKSRERIETGHRKKTYRDKDVSPGRKAGSGLKLDAPTDLMMALEVSPGRKAGSGLKLAPAVTDTGLQARFSRPKSRERIETPYSPAK
jgi:hypothetical protein